MANVSTARKVGIAARIAGQQVKRSKTYGAVASGVRATLSHFAGVLHQLWLEITGFVFLAFAGVGLVALVREFNSFHAGKGTSSHLAVAAGFTAVFGWFGISSFWRARNRR
jgi:predicted tellurium resistance membrane protein TerC